MNQAVSISRDFISVRDNQLTTSSIFIAQAFEKRHADVLRKIDELLSQVPDYFGKRNFALSEREQTNNLGYKVKTKTYELTKDGFMLLVMGFTGKLAMQVKIAYIEAFNQMAELLGNKTPSPYLSDEQLAHIKYGVRLKVLASGKSWQAVYRELFEHVQAPSVREIKAERFSDACRFLGISTSLRGISEQDLVPVDALPAPADVALIPFGLKKDATYMVWVRDGKARRRELLFGELFGDRRQEWCADSVGDW